MKRPWERERECPSPELRASATQKQTWHWAPPDCGQSPQGCNVAATAGAASCSAQDTDAADSHGWHDRQANYISNTCLINN